MGLDMYIEKFPRVATPKVINDTVEYLNWKDKGRTESLYDWCGVEASDLPDAETIKELEGLMHTTYYAWDEGKTYPRKSIPDEVGYWRKANAVHKWFVDNVQHGQDDCGYHEEVTKGKLIELRDKCAYIMDNAVMAKGKVSNGYTFKNGAKEPILEDGFIVTNKEVCEQTLPSQSGFFFGGTEYDEYYIEDIRYTLDLCNKLIEETDFERYALYYTSSW